MNRRQGVLGWSRRKRAARGLVALLLSLATTRAWAHGDPRARMGTAAFGLSAEVTSLSASPRPARMEPVEVGGEHFVTISLARLANASLDPPNEWRERIWKGKLRQLPRGRQVFAGVPFFVVPPGRNRGLAAVALVGGRYRDGPRGGGALSIGRRAAALYVLHTASYQNLQAGRVTATYRLRYADGEVFDVAVRNRREVADFMHGRDLSADCVLGWLAEDPLLDTHYGVHVLRVVNPHPEKTIASIELRPARGAAVVSVIGLTLGDGAPALSSLPGAGPVEEPAAIAGPRGQLVLRIEADGKRTAARLVVRGPDGRSYEPVDALGYEMLPRGEAFFYAKGEASLEVPAGTLTVGVAKGFEYQPVEFTIDVPAGAIVQRTVTLDRWIDLPARGWFSGEMHIHPFDQEPRDTAVCLAAEDLHVANLLVWANGFTERRHGDQFFRGRPERWPDRRHVAYYNQEFRNNVYGHLCLVGLRSLVFPMGVGSEYGREDYPPNADIVERVHAQDGFASIAHLSIPPGEYAGPWEVAVDAALGRVDSVDIDLTDFDRTRDRSLDLWYRLLNTGHRLPATCGTDAFMNSRWINIPPGHLRTYGHVGARFSYRRWLEAVRRGRSFVSQGPALFLTVGGTMPGDTIILPPGRNRLAVRVEAAWLATLPRVELVVNGEVAASVEPPPDARAFVWETTLDLDGSAWVAARAEGAGNAAFQSDLPRAHTNPVYCDGVTPRRSPADARFFVGEIDGLLDWVAHRGRFRTSRQKAKVEELFGRARRLFAEQASGDEAAAE